MTPHPQPAAGEKPDVKAMRDRCVIESCPKCMEKAVSTLVNNVLSFACGSEQLLKNNGFPLGPLRQSEICLRIASLESSIARVTAERDEAVGLLREVRDRWPWDDAYVKQVADIIWHHAPPVPEWRERPTCAGWWDYIEFPTDIRRTILLIDGDLNWARGLTNQWYGPIPPSPEQQNAE